MTVVIADAPAPIVWEHPRAYAGFDPTQQRAADGTWSKDEAEEKAVEVEDADSPIVKLHLKMLAKIPARLRRILAEAGVRWQVSAKSVGEMRPDLENPPRGWPEGTTWDDVAGVYLPGENLILVGRAQEGSASVMLHETGHALAHVLSLDNEQALVALQKAKGIKAGSYYAGAAGREELLAESFAVRIALGQAEAKRRYGKKYVAWLDATLGIPPDKKPAQTGPVTLGRAFEHPREFRFDPNQPRDREGKWTRVGTISGHGDQASGGSLGGRDRRAAGEAGSQLPAAETTFAEVDDDAGRQRFLRALQRNSRAWNLSAHDLEHLRDSKVFLTEDEDTGFIVTADGDLQNVFSNSSERGRGALAVKLAITQGARTLDAYDGFLPGYYAKFGFRETARVPFSDEYAPDGWDYEQQGRPDVVFMAYGPDRDLFDPDQPRAPDGKWTKAPGLDPGSLVGTLRAISGMMNNVNPRSRGIGPYNHVLRQGRVFKDFLPIRPDEDNDVKQQCFMNATHLAMQPGFTYVEGYAFHGDLDVGLPVHHAWAVDDQGRVYDPTWGNPEGSSYVGIPIDTNWLIGEISDSGVYGVLSETSRDVLHDGIPSEAVVDIGDAIPAP